METTQDKNKILIFSVTYLPFIGGAEIALNEITTKLNQSRFDLITAKLDQDLDYQERQGNVTIWRVGKGNKIDKYLYPVRAFLLACKLHQKNQYRLVWSMMATWAGVPALFFKLRHRQVKYFLTLQSGDSDLFIWLRTWFWYPIYKMIYTRADHIQAISQWLAKRARKYGYKGQISIIPNGVDLLKIKRAPAEGMKAELKIPENNKIIFTSSRLVAKNDIESLIRAYKLLSQLRSKRGVDSYQLQITLLIAGTGKLKTKLKHLASQLKLTENIIFLGRTDNDKVLSYCKQSDIFVRPSLSEGQGVSFIEAMASGTPIIATPVGGIPDFLLDRKTGLFCKVKNPEDLAQKIEILLGDDQLYQGIRQNALKLVEAKYNWDLIANQISTLFDKIWKE